MTVTDRAGGLGTGEMENLLKMIKNIDMMYVQWKSDVIIWVSDN